MSQPVQRPPWVRECRKDGWPFCPQCEEDELWSANEPPTLETIVSCLACGWRPPTTRTGDPSRP